MFDLGLYVLDEMDIYVFAFSFRIIIHIFTCLTLDCMSLINFEPFI